MSIYYDKLKVLWDELSVFDTIPGSGCGKDKILLDKQKREYVIQFLMGLSDAYINVRD